MTSVLLARIRSTRGFTLIELVVVMSLIVLLATIGLSAYQSSVRRGREAVLREDLFRMRDAIDQYYADKGKYPESLDALASEKYLRSLPVDPITESNATWVIVPPDDPKKGAVYDIKSGAQGNASDGKPYSEW